MINLCSECGKQLEGDELFDYRVINAGLPQERRVCNECFDSLWEDYKIVLCENCGDWFDNELTRDEALSERLTFNPCPACGHDMIEGYTRQEMLDREQEG